MKKFLFLILFIAALVPAKPLVFDICYANFCYVQIVDDAKSWQWMTDYTGKKFVRVFLFNRNILDINGHGKEIKARK